MTAHVGLGLLMGALTLAGCASLESASSGQIGCAEEDIVITNDEGGIGTRTWVASCHGKKFFCSAVAGGESTQVTCKEAIADERTRQFGDSGEMVRRRAETSSPEPAPSGCQFDTQCKGDRICDDGECVSPRRASKKNATADDAPAADPPSSSEAQ